MTVEVLSLQSADCLDPQRAGAKAARLAAALRARLPVLPGVVIPVGADAGVLARAAAVVGERGVHAARLSVMDSATPSLACLGGELRALGDDLVVRSSSPYEDAPDRAGAFTSYDAVTAAEAATAVRGVWASALTDDGVDAGPPRMAVLVQPRVHASVSGTAHMGGDGEVTVVAVRGEPAPLLAGWARGDAGAVDAAGVARGPAVALAGAGLIAEVAALMARVNRELGDDLIEWAAADGRVILLQAKRGAPRRPPASPRTGAERVPAAAAGAARLVHAFAGPLGEALVLPVLLAGVGRASTPPAVPAPAQLTRAAAQAAWAAARARSGTLRARAWGERDRDGGGASAILAALRGGEVAGAVDRLAALPAPGATDVAALLLDLGTVAAWMAQTALISTPDQLWAMTVDGAARHLAAAEPARTAPEPREARRRALLRWEPFVHTAVAATGTALAGDAVSAGTGAGPAVVVPGLPTAAVPLARMVVVAPHPIPQLAPLLWGAAGLVTAGGGASAHLVEVARSRGVPAVLGCDGELLFALLGDGAAGPRLVAVDGDGGRVVIDARP